MYDERFLGCWSQAAAQFMSVHSAGIFLASFEHVDECECETIKTATAEIVAQALAKAFLEEDERGKIVKTHVDVFPRLSGKVLAHKSAKLLQIQLIPCNSLISRKS